MPTRSAEERGVCDSCTEVLDGSEIRCPACGALQLHHLPDSPVTPAEVDGDLTTAPRWAVLLTGLALGIPIAPLVVYAAIIAGVDLSLLGQAALGLGTWLFVGWYLSRLPNPSAALARGLYLVAGGIGVVLVALVVDASSGQPAVELDLFGLALVALAVPATLAALLARRVTRRAARQARGESGRLHELAGVEDGTNDQSDDTES